MPDITGQVLRDRYQIERLLGRGGMADVYLAFDTQRQTLVALKLIREDLADDTDFIRRFSREAAALARLDHPNVVRFYSTEQDGPLSFIVMDYVPGSTLQRRLAQAGGPLPIPEVTALLHQIGSALHYAHSLGFIHRDIKPGNIMLREDGTALLSDFGAARVAENATLASLTIGTPAYMSPEQILGRELEAPSDIYSFGLVLYEMLTGRRPFSGDEAGLTGTGTISRLREAHLRLEPPNPSLLNPLIPQALSAVVLKSLTKDVSDRWSNVVSLMDAWDAALGGSRRRAKGAAAVMADSPSSTAATFAPTVASAGITLASPSQSPATSQPVSMPAAPMPPPSAESAPPTKGRRPLWLVAGAVGLLVVLLLAAWQLVLPALASSRTNSQPNAGVAAATEQALSAQLAAATVTASQLALDQKSQALSTSEAQGAASAARLAETATAVGKSLERVAASDATATAQAVLSAQAAATAAAAATQSSQAAAATATDQAARAAESTVAAAATATAAAAPTDTVTPAPTIVSATKAPAATVPPKATVPPASPAQPGVITGFEGNANWQIGDQHYGSFDRSTEQAYSGSASGRLKYDFPAVANNFVVFRARPTIPLPGQPTGLSAWVYGDGSGNYLNAWVQDSAGQVRQYTFGRVAHQGWQQMTAWFDDAAGWPNVHISGYDSGKLAFPASLFGLVLDGVPDGQASAGTIYLDDIKTVTQPIPAAGATPAASAGATAAIGGAADAAKPAPVALNGKIAVAAFDPGRSTYDLYVGSASGEGVGRVLDSASQPELSPAGGQVAYRRWNNSDRGLAIMSAKGGAERRLTHFLEDALPSWSPGGDRLVFASRREPDRKARLYSVAATGGPDAQLKRGPDPVFGEYPTWMSDGNIVYRSTYPDQGLVVMNPDGSNPRTILPDASATAPAENPVSKQIAFMSQRDGNWEIYRMAKDGSGPTRLTNNPANDGLPAWSPDGSSLAFLSDRDGSWGVWVMTANGGDQRKLFALPGSPDGRVAKEPDYSSRGWTEERLSWSG